MRTGHTPLCYHVCDRCDEVCDRGAEHPGEHLCSNHAPRAAR